MSDAALRLVSMERRCELTGSRPRPNGRWQVEGLPFSVTRLASGGPQRPATSGMPWRVQSHSRQAWVLLDRSGLRFVRFATRREAVAALDVELRLSPNWRVTDPWLSR